MEEEKKKLTKKINIILESTGVKSLTSREIMFLVFKLLDKEFSTPRPQRETELRVKGLITALDLILATHFSPVSSISFIGSIGELLIKRHPGLILGNRNTHEKADAYTT